MLPGTLLATSSAQRIPTSSMNLMAGTKGAVPVSFKTDGKLSEYITPAEPIEWGMDVAWDWDVNVVRGTNYIGKDILKVGRVSFQPSIMKDENTLSDWQIKNLQTRLNHIALSGVKNIELNCDHEVLMNKDTYPDCDKNYAAYNGKPQIWFNVIKATTIYCQRMGFNVIAVSPFNEPDYTDWKEGSKADFKAIAQLISEDPFFEGIRICGGNTLNCDQAASWYNYLKPYVTEGNTHQLAGSMSTYTNFWKTVRADGNHATADELHNTMEAFIAIHHGMQTGIWWGFEGACRGEFCKASALGKEIGYAEDANTWTGAAVYKWNRPKTAQTTSELPETEERINAFVGASERQAKPQTYSLVSTDRPVFYDGYGPVYSYPVSIPADPKGTYNSDNQKNAETMLGIQYGEDVPTDYPRSGTFIIMNANSKCGISSQYIPSVQQMKYAPQIGPTEYYFWTIEPIANDIGGDFGYCTIKKYNSTDGQNLTTNSEWGLDANISVKYGANWANGQRNHWFFEYTGDNLWYIRNRWTGLYLQPQNGNTATKTIMVMSAFTGQPEQKWRFIPALVPQTTANKKLNGMLEFDAPVAPTGLKTQQLSASTLITWDKNTDSDIKAYNVLRSKASTPSVASSNVEGGVSAFSSASSADQWDVIGRMIEDTAFIDNDITPGVTYIYKVKAVDRSRNISEASAPVSAESKPQRALIARYTFEKSLCDQTQNQLDPAITGTESYKNPITGIVKEGETSLAFDGSSTFLTLPPSIGSLREMTICGWVYNSSYSTNWTRIFDFGNDTDHYFFLTPNGDGFAKVVMKNGGAEQTLMVSKDKFTNGWHYVAVTLSESEVKLYIDSKEYTSTSIKIRPADFNPRANFIGASQYAVDPLFNGYIDDLRIYNYALSAAEIATLKLGKELPTGDANGDGKVTIEDANIVLNYALGDTSIDINIDAVDMDLNEKITIDDAKAIVDKYLTE